MALIAHAATLKTRIPFLHFFDGFRTSHEVAKLELLPDECIRAMIDDELVEAHRQRGLDPELPVLRGTAQNPDVFFQAREAANPFYLSAAGAVQETMNEFAEQTGRQYRLFDYVGAPDAQRVMVMMGSGVGAASEAVQKLADEGEKSGIVERPAVPAIFGGRFDFGIAQVNGTDGRIGSHEGAGRLGRTALPGRCGGFGRDLGGDQP